MPYADELCGVYCIETPNGSQYIGSSVKVKTRWGQHRRCLRNGKHHCSRLQAAYAKHGNRLTFRMLEICDPSVVRQREQHYIDALGAELNSAQVVDDVRSDPLVRQKLAAFHSSPEWRESRRLVGRTPRDWWVPVISSDGMSFECMSDAAKHYGLKTSQIRHMVVWQHLHGRLGIRLRKANQDWLPVLGLSEKISATRAANGTSHSAETRDRMRVARRGRGPSAHAAQRALEVNKKPVIGVHLATGETIEFASARDAGRAIHPVRVKTATAQITKACLGIKRSAYGYAWVKAQAKRDAMEVAHG